MHLLNLIPLILLHHLSPLIDASPLSSRTDARDTLVAYPVVQQTAYTTYAYYASSAYCSPTKIMKWNCGDMCTGNSLFIPLESGGDGAFTQYWFVGYDPVMDSVIVAHQGTDPIKIISMITDLDFIQVGLDPSLFPGLRKSIKVHHGFAFEHAKTAGSILTAVQKALSQYSTSHVTIIGHSLGGALSLLDSVYLPLHLPKSVSFNLITFGLPRVGNQDFADYVDAHVVNKTHINNREDIIPTVPPISFGFHHPSGEVHIQDNGQWLVCPGQDNSDRRCTTGDVNIASIIKNIIAIGATALTGGLLDVLTDSHNGPYGGVDMGGCSLPF